MNPNLKPGDRVRLKDSISFGTVVEVVCPIAEGPPGRVMVEWDGHEGEPGEASPDDLHYVRPPPTGWAEPGPAMGAPLSYRDR
jgi:hypothetical protein